MCVQTGPGVYDERVFRSLDYVVFKARQYNVRVSQQAASYGSCCRSCRCHLQYCFVTAAVSALKLMCFAQLLVSFSTYWQVSCCSWLLMLRLLAFLLAAIMLPLLLPCCCAAAAETCPPLPSSLLLSSDTNVPHMCRTATESSRSLNGQG